MSAALARRLTARVASRVQLTRPTLAATVTQSRSFATDFSSSPQSVSQQYNPSKPQSSTPSSTPYPFPPSIFGSYSVHKKNAALTFRFERASVEQRQTIKYGFPYYTVKHEGALRVEFAPATQPDTTATTVDNDKPMSTDVRSYNWTNKQIMMLSCNEIGDILAFTALQQPTELKFFHDPGKLKDNEGLVRKELTVKKAPGGNKGYYFNLTVNNKEKGRVSLMCSVSEGEMKVLETLCRNALPQLLGMATVTPIIEQPA